MAGEVVGTAFVRIKALTNSLARDIEKDVKKSLNDANLDRIGEESGEDFGTSFSRRAGRQITGTIEESVKNANVDTEGRGLGQRLGDSLKDGLTAALSTKRRSLADQLLGRRGKTELRRLQGLIAEAFNPRAIFVFAGALAAPVITGALQALSQALITMVGQIGFIGEAFIGAGIAGGAAMASIGAAIIPLIFAFTTVTPELEAFKEVAAEVGDDFKSIGEETQRTLLPGLTRALQRTRVLIPIFSEFGAVIGAITSDIVEYAAAALTSERAQGRFRVILESSAVVFGAFLRIVLRLGDVLSAIWVAAAPVAEQFMHIIEDIVTRLQTSINMRLDSGELAASFQSMFDRARLFFGAIGDILVGLKNILEIGADSTLPMFESFSVFAQEWRNFTESTDGQGRIREVFDNALPIAREVWGLVSDLFQMLFRSTFNVDDTSAGLIGAIQGIRAALPGIEEGFGKIIDDLREPLGEFAAALGRFFTAFQEAGGLEKTLDVITGLTEALTALLNVPGFSDFIGTFAAALGLIKFLGIPAMLSAVAQSFVILGAVLTTVFGGTAIGVSSAALGAIGASAAAVGGAIGFLIATLDPLKAAFVGIIAVVGGALAIFFGGPVVAAIGAGALIGAAIGLIIRHFDTLKEALAAVVRFFQDPMERLERIGPALANIGGTIADFAGNLLGSLGGALSSLGGMLSDIGGSIVDFLAELGGDILEEFVEQIGLIPDRLGDALGFLGDLFTDLGPIILEGLGDFGEMLLELLVDGITFVIRSIPRALRMIAEQFVRLPFLILTGLRNLGIQILELFISAISLVIIGVVRSIQGIIAIFTNIGPTILGALSSLGSIIADAFRAAIDFVISFLTDTVPGIIEFFINLPGEIIEGLVNFGQMLWEVFDAAVDAVIAFLITEGPGILDWFSRLPGQILDFLVDLPGNLIQVFVDAVTGIVNVMTTFFTQTAPGFVSDMLGFAGDLIGAIAEGLGQAIEGASNIAEDIVNGIINFINSEVIDRINTLLEFEIDPTIGPTISIDVPNIDHIPNIGGNEYGSIITRPTLSWLGEGFKPEVVIPLTNPDRALELFNQSGLAEVLSRASGGGNAATSYNAARSTSVTTPASGRSGPTFAQGAVLIDARGESPAEIYDHFQARIGWEIGARGDE